MNSQDSQTNLETIKQAKEQERRLNLQNALVFAFQRTQSEPFDVSGTITDVLKEFPRLSSEGITQALRNGGLGKYGRTFRLSTQEICYWIREYLKPVKVDKL